MTSSFNNEPVQRVCKTTHLFNLSSELSITLLRLIAQHGQVESIVRPTAEPTIKPTIETTFNAHQYMIQADCNRFNNIPIDI
jgi:hypothetical protein